MPYFAKVNDSGIVASVIEAEQDFIDTQEGTWVEGSVDHVSLISDVNASLSRAVGDTPLLRKNYVSVGHIYDSDSDVFYEPKPHASWTLNDDSFLWISPIVRPDDDRGRKRYIWDDDVYQANNSLGCVEL